LVDSYDGVRVADRNGGEFDDLAVSEVDLVSISPTFYEQLLSQNPFAKKLQTQIVSASKLRKKLLYEKAAR
jgi:hypothetical protein